jgi:hypothetical protein
MKYYWGIMEALEEKWANDFRITREEDVTFQSKISTH